MPLKTGFASLEDVVKHKAPATKGRQSEAIDHSVIIDKIKYELGLKGYTIAQEDYKTTTNLNVIQGIYRLDQGIIGEDFKMLFTFCNSYDSPNDFVCSSGIYCTDNNYMMIPSFLEKTAPKTKFTLAQAMDRIELHTTLITRAYNELLSWVNVFIETGINEREQATIIGRLYAELELITLTQVGMIKKELETNRIATGIKAITGWEMYIFLQTALAESHPRSIIEHHSILHNYFSTELNTDVIRTVTETDTFQQEAQKVEATTQETVVVEEKVWKKTSENISELKPASYVSPIASVIFL